MDSNNRIMMDSRKTRAEANALFPQSTASGGAKLIYSPQMAQRNQAKTYAERNGMHGIAGGEEQISPRYGYNPFGANTGGYNGPSIIQLPPPEQIPMTELPTGPVPDKPTGLAPGAGPLPGAGPAYSSDWMMNPNQGGEQEGNPFMPNAGGYQGDYGTMIKDLLARQEAQNAGQGYGSGMGMGGK